MNKITEILLKMDACGVSVSWAEREKFTSRQEAWDACKSPAWLFWYLGKTGGASRKKIVLAACACSQLALPFANSGPAARVAIRATEAWARGKGSIRAVKAAAAGANAAFNGSGAYAYASAFAAADAVYSCSPSHSASYAATHAVEAALDSLGYAGDVQRRCCATIRKVFPKV